MSDRETTDVSADDTSRKGEVPADDTPANDTPQGPAASESPADEQRRKFREALDKKKLGHHGHGMNSQTGVQSAHTAPAVQKRVHRRKSG